GALAVYIQYYGVRTVLCSSSGGTLCSTAGMSSTIWLAVVGAILIVDSLVSFAAIRISFVVAAVLSILIFAITIITWGGYDMSYSAVILILSAVTVLVDAVASRPPKALSERDSPLNLPVFG
ncbi:MAG: hypothetical protein OK454_06165, partial [Thaumarchaeota archaeon]|nr:hypothetical protein [Nitrososphaerota archaeon]